jgi:hypothetical protein
MIKYNFILYDMHITAHLHVVKDFWKILNYENILNF